MVRVRNGAGETGGDRQTASSLSAGSFPFPAKVLTVATSPDPGCAATSPHPLWTVPGENTPYSGSGRRSQNLPGSGQMELRPLSSRVSPQWAQKSCARTWPSPTEAEISRNIRKGGKSPSTWDLPLRSRLGWGGAQGRVAGRTGQICVGTLTESQTTHIILYRIELAPPSMYYFLFFF